MKETTRKILSALASAADGEVDDLPLERELYPDLSVQAAVKAFEPFCYVRAYSPAGSAPARLGITVRSEYRLEGRQVIGEFFNFLLNHAVSGLSDREDR